MPKTLSIYFAKSIINHFFLVLIIAIITFFVIGIIDYLKHLIGFSSAQITFASISLLALARVPYLIQEAFPYLVFLASIVCFSNLSARSEYIIARTSGLSAISFIKPFLFVIFFIAFVFIIILNPITASCYEYANKKGSKLFSNNAQLTFSFSGNHLWFIDKLPNEDSIRMVSASHLVYDEGKLMEVTFIKLDNHFNFIERIDADSAKLNKNMWELSNAKLFQSSQRARNLNSFTLPTLISAQELKNSLVVPESISLWKLPEFIDNIKNAGYSVVLHSAYFYKLIFRPFLVCSMVLIAGSFALNSARSRKTAILILSSTMVAFILNFISELGDSFLYNGRITPFYSILFTVSVILLLSINIYTRRVH